MDAGGVRAPGRVSSHRLPPVEAVLLVLGAALFGVGRLLKWIDDNLADFGGDE